MRSYKCTQNTAQLTQVNTLKPQLGPFYVEAYLEFQPTWSNIIIKKNEEKARCFIFRYLFSLTEIRPEVI